MSLLLRIGRRLQSTRVKPDVGGAARLYGCQVARGQESDGRGAKRSITTARASGRVNGIYVDAKHRDARRHRRIVYFLLDLRADWLARERVDEKQLDFIEKVMQATKELRKNLCYNISANTS